VVLFASVVVAVVLLVVLFSWAFQRRLIYLPSTSAVPSAATMLAGARDVQRLLHESEGTPGSAHQTKDPPVQRSLRLNEQQNLSFGRSQKGPSGFVRQPLQLTTSDGLRLGRGTSRRAARPIHSRFWLPMATLVTAACGRPLPERWQQRIRGVAVRLPGLWRKPREPKRGRAGSGRTLRTSVPHRRGRAQ
jgi:hypothetical protein